MGVAVKPLLPPHRTWPRPGGWTDGTVCGSQGWTRRHSAGLGLDIFTPPGGSSIVTDPILQPGKLRPESVGSPLWSPRAAGAGPVPAALSPAGGVREGPLGDERELASEPLSGKERGAQ